MRRGHSAHEIKVLEGGRKKDSVWWYAFRLMLLVGVVGLMFGFWLGFMAGRATASHSPRTSWASWYGPGFYGHRTACGGYRLTTHSYIVAHRSLPCWTRVFVCYRNRCTYAVVGDRGPYNYNRELDLGPGVRERLHFDGVHQVRWWVGG